MIMKQEQQIVAVSLETSKFRLFHTSKKYCKIEDQSRITQNSHYGELLFLRTVLRNIATNMHTKFEIVLT